MSDIWALELHQLSCLTVGGSMTYSHIYIQIRLWQDGGVAAGT